MDDNEVLKLVEIHNKEKIYTYEDIILDKELFKIANGAYSLYFPISLLGEIKHEKGKIIIHTKDNFKTFNIKLKNISKETRAKYNERYNQKH